MSDNQPPPQVPDYDLIRTIGEGGFGQVWLATNRTTGRLRAVKLIGLQRSGKTDAAGREIVSLTRLEANQGCRHPNLLSVHHVGKTAEYLFYVMDLADDISGRPATDNAQYEPATLQRRLEGGPLQAEQGLSCARQLLGGLASLHDSGMVHRDVKPANCLFVAGELKLADFSLLTEAHPLVSRAGTQKYMPPDGHMDVRADVYAAGLVIYEMVTGLPVDRFPSLGERGPDVVDNPAQSALVQIALRACERDPQRRFKNAGEMLDSLEKLKLKLTDRRRIGRFSMVIVGALILLAVIATGIWLSPSQRVHVNFVTHPFEATIALDGVLQVNAQNVPYRTPCTIEDLSAKTHLVTFKHDELGDLNVGQKDFTRQRRVEASWEGTEISD